MSTCRAGDRIRLDYMPKDPDPIPTGATGTVQKVANAGTTYEQVWVKWDPPNHDRSLMLVPGEDRFTIIASLAMVVTRPVAKGECHNFADRAVAKGEVLYRYRGATYGCVDFDNGVALTEEPDKTPFFEFPKDAVEARP